MAHQNPEETTETSSDFMTFQMESSSIEVSEESKKADAHRFFADQNKMKDFISCRNCKKEFDHVFHKPFLLPCLDAICKSCIQEISESQSYECSKCSHIHTCFQNDKILLQIDNTREIASEIFRLKSGGSSLICEMCTNDQIASHRCFDCSDFICKDCVRLHLSLKTLKSHSFIEIKCLLTGKVKNLGLSYVSKYCQVAGHEKEQIKMHCSDPSCMKNVCVLCAISAHKNHNLCNITEVGKEMETKMETFLKSIELKVEKANTSIAHLTVINETCLKNSQQLQAEIKACFCEAKKALEKREKDLCEAVALHLKEKQICIETEKKKISSFSRSCEEAICYGKVSSEVNDHNHFVDITNVILPQLEILDNQLPEIEVTLDTMTFSSQSLDSCFETAVNSLGKLSVSNVYMPECKVVVTPAVCYVGQQIQFKIQLFSSTGNLIVDEDVSVCLKLNGKSFEFINCAFETSSSSFTGFWVPDKSMKISWIVVSNDIELQTLNGVFDIRKTDTSITDSRHGSSVDPKMNDFPIFETATGMVICADSKEVREIEEMKKTVQDTGCKAEINKNNLSIHIESNLSQNVKARQRLIERWEKDASKMDTMRETFLIAKYPMSKRDYQAVKFFGNKLDLFKGISNHVEHTEGSLCISVVDANSIKNIADDINQILMSVKMMSSESVSINVNDLELKKAMQDVEQKKPNVCLIKSDNDIEIISENYIDLQEAKGLLIQMTVGKTKESLQLSAGKVNRRASRTFVKTEEESSNLEMLEKNNQDTNSNKMRLSMNQSMRSRKVELKTKEGLIILIYAGSITRLEVDCIVSAANENLMHCGGVAAAISEAAGYQFDQESRDYVQKNGPISVGRCCVTSAGKLPYKCVIHTVGPRWGDYKDKKRCLQDLQDSVEATFKEAYKRNMRSIAIPAISCGIFAVPRDKCVEEYYRAAMSFSKNYSFKSLQEIHFVDRDETMVRAIQEFFLQREPSATIIGKSETLEKKNDTNAFVVEETVHSTMPLSNSFTTVNVSNSLQIMIHIGNITDIATEAIVCPQDENYLSKDAIAKYIFRMIPDQQPLPQKMSYGDICSQGLKENSKWKMIIHAITPVYDSEYAKYHAEFAKILKNIIQKIIKTADEARLHSIAIPLLGTGTEEYRTPVETCASTFFKAVMANKSELMYLNEIYLVLKEEIQEKMYLEDFAFINCKITQRPVTNNGKSDDFGKTMKEMPKECENCCICMDTPTKPKQLRKCGHIFCKECIEQYFEYKPTCPSCGTIYGKVTGDQPPGIMSIRTIGSRLEGFNDSSGTIVLTYIFNDGKQGEEHPDPGKVYKGFSRSGYLPNNKKGKLIAKLLNVAFSRRLVFTIGRSRTTGHDGVITWNDIHHKTRMEGGPARFGYPDPAYLDQVLEELEAKGVTEESADDPEEYKEYSRQIGY